jgi:hypothetical protein
MRRLHRTLLMAASVLVGCNVYDSGKVEPTGGGQAGGAGMGPVDSGVLPDSGPSVVDAGGPDAAMCVPQPAETCNLIDDDCDGDTDEDTQAGCEQIIANGVAECVELSGEARCVLRTCHQGFSNCDGNPTNGCEAPYCMCHDCPLDDAGEPIFIGDDGGV